jgi:hypothetical protein
MVKVEIRFKTLIEAFLKPVCWIDRKPKMFFQKMPHLIHDVQFPQAEDSDNQTFGTTVMLRGPGPGDDDCYLAKIIKYHGGFAMLVMRLRVFAVIVVLRISAWV